VTLLQYEQLLVAARGLRAVGEDPDDIAARNMSSTTAMASNAMRSASAAGSTRFESPHRSSPRADRPAMQSIASSNNTPANGQGLRGGRGPPHDRRLTPQAIGDHLVVVLVHATPGHEIRVPN
jgi:hypothetical protein